MLIDKQHVLSDAQAITADAGSTNVYDTRMTKGFSQGNPVGVRCSIDETFTLLTSLTIQLRSSAASDMSSPRVHLSRTVVAADLVAQNVIDMGEFPEETLRYLDVYYDVTGTNPGAGKITTFLNPLGGGQNLPGKVK